MEVDGSEDADGALEGSTMNSTGGIASTLCLVDFRPQRNLFCFRRY